MRCLLRRVAPTTARCASPRALPSWRAAEVRHFSHRTGPVYASPLPPCQGQSGTRVFCRDAVPSFRYAVIFARPRFRGKRRLLLTLASRVRITHRRFHLCATPTLGLGWSTCSTAPLRVRPNAAVLLFSRYHRYSPAIQTHYVPHLLSQVRESGVRRLVSGGFALYTGIYPCIGLTDRDPWSFLPARKHLSECYLIPAHYSCRRRSPVGSEARNAISDFTGSPFPSTRLSPRGVCGRVRHTSFG